MAEWSLFKQLDKLKVRGVIEDVIWHVADGIMDGARGAGSAILWQLGLRFTSIGDQANE